MESGGGQGRQASSKGLVAWTTEHESVASCQEVLSGFFRECV